MEIFKLFIAGDFCPIGRNEIKFIKNDFSPLQAIKNIVDKADYAVVNLESPLTSTNKKIDKSGPNIKASPETVKALQFLNIDLVTLANNHILDSNGEGVADTIKVCSANEIKAVGAGVNLFEARKPHNVKISNKKIAILNFAENEFCAATEHSAGANPVNEISNFYDIRKAKEENDWVVVIVHGGREHYQLPTPKQRDRFRFYAEVGADLVVGHHTHCFSGYEIYKDTPIFYSLGNFIFDYKKKYQHGKWTEGFAVMFSFSDRINFEIIPFKQGRTVNPNLTLLNGDEERDFYTKINELNNIIVDDILFKKNWNAYLKTQVVNYKGMLFIQNKYIRAAISRKLLPSWFFHSKKHKTLLLNLFRCETHHEIMTTILENKSYSNER